MELTILKYLIEYGILGILGFFFIRQQNKNFSMIQEQYKNLVDNLMITQKETLKELKKSIDSLVIIIRSKVLYDDSNKYDNLKDRNKRDFSSD